METELKHLIDKIKEEGVQQAERDAKNIIACAEENARDIIKDAEKKKATSIKEAQIQALNFRKASEEALKQAGRDVLLTLRGKVVEFFDRIIKEKISQELTPQELKDIIKTAVENFRKNSDLDIEVLVSKKDEEKLQKALFSTLSQEAKKHLTLKGTLGIEKGFRIGEKGKDSYFDFSDGAISEAFSKYLNPKLIEILDTGLGLDKK